MTTTAGHSFYIGPIQVVSEKKRFETFFS
jgi:hypothetical protein